MIVDKFISLIKKIEEGVEALPGLIPEDKQKIIAKLLIEAAVAYGKAMVKEKMES